MIVFLTQYRHHPWDNHMCFAKTSTILTKSLIFRSIPWEKQFALFVLVEKQLRKTIIASKQFVMVKESIIYYDKHCFIENCKLKLNKAGEVVSILLIEVNIQMSNFPAIGKRCCCTFALHDCYHSFFLWKRRFAWLFIQYLGLKLHVANRKDL